VSDGAVSESKGTSTKVVATIVGIVVALSVYFVLLGQRGISLIQDGGAVPVVLGIAVLVLPILGVWMVWSTIRSGFQHQHLVSRAQEEGRDLDVSDLPKMPSGRVQRDAADALFAEVKAEWEADPDNWVTNYRLARAYDYAGDRSRAREIMKRAVALEAVDGER
jgi:ABC-type nickel/cobalt efflux system permease component RcnA